MSVAIRLMGGLGNQMFQIATGETWRSWGTDVVYTNMDENLEYISRNYAFKRHSNEYKTLWRGFDWDAHKAPQNASFKPVRVPFTYTPIVPHEGSEYIGYFQSEKNFPNRELIKKIFEPTEALEAMFNWDYSEITCSIHVRRQDYLNLKDYHTVLGIEYYRPAIEKMIKEFNVSHFFVFSDDIRWCKEHFTGECFTFMDSREYVALYQMNLCSHNIIGNSSLSWWGAWLWEHPYLWKYPDKRIIAPERWFGPLGQNPRDIIPDRWIKL